VFQTDWLAPERYNQIVAGSDTTYDASRSRGLADEVAELVRIGMPPMDAIKAATSVSAECIGVEKRVGTIKPGMAADFIVVERDPLSDITSLQDLLLVIHDGKVIVNRLNP
jgi:imidazolonepropionase-like amidohydrolase